MMRFLFWLRCAVRGHQRVRAVSHGGARWDAFVISFAPQPDAEHSKMGPHVEFLERRSFHYEPCRDCGALYLHRMVSS